MVQSFEGNLAVECLTPGFVDGDRYEPSGGSISQPREHVLACFFRYRLGAGQIEAQGDAGIGTIGMLTTRTTGGAKAPGELAWRDEIRTDLHDQRPIFHGLAPDVNHFPIRVVMSEGRAIPTAPEWGKDCER